MPKSPRKKKHEKQYAAKLLFQYRVVIDGDSGKRRICVESIINYTARGPRDALRTAKRHGKNAELDYLNDQGNPVYFEFVDILDLIELGIECSDNEVWYDVRERLCPMERKDKILPPEDELNVFITG